MEVQLKSIGKKFNYNWVFRGLDFDLTSGGRYAIIGSNGSGKSTLLQIISGFITPSEGGIHHLHDGSPVGITEVYRYIGLTTPYLELLEDLSLLEFLEFHKRFKNPRNGLSTGDVIEICRLQSHAKKELKNYSSGMRQRVRIALSILYDNQLLLLDEPTTHLDRAGVDWYLQLVNDHLSGRTLVISSNEPREYPFCKDLIEIENYRIKPHK